MKGTFQGRGGHGLSRIFTEREEYHRVTRGEMRGVSRREMAFTRRLSREDADRMVRSPCDDSFELLTFPNKYNIY